MQTVTQCGSLLAIVHVLCAHTEPCSEGIVAIVHPLQVSAFIDL